ncbi:hypothetical protein SLNWT_2468 [Streptomyces albus]|uniref:Uncharacterized protein n=1 Tax=Streptomyces albus (strain ATCC 21838 / DSM 41398 / FERM P-419 / JCM 4703 / NBRC 107858) TaxID=1081613 RepID=A0A0B5EMT8_STRA4|nr:hypothetical protein SLNWT_2468 [Streptomyces albus]AOU77156.1 hypothetical protein SLNHY_2465 [Streptomyces albus]AYN32934.1 hypothetical protein DUI70_2432 [Streptomyces albus]
MSVVPYLLGGLREGPHLSDPRAAVGPCARDALFPGNGRVPGGGSGPAPGPARRPARGRPGTRPRTCEKKSQELA